MCLFEVAAYQLMRKASGPGCGHGAVLSGHALWWLFQRKHRRDHLDYVRQRLACRRRNLRTAVGRRPPTVASLPMPDEGEWTRAVQRHRS